jgi:hypothetical protein
LTFSHLSKVLSCTKIAPIPHTDSAAALAFLPDNPRTLLIGGPAGKPSAAVYAVPVIRNRQKHIIGFGRSSQISTAPGIKKGGIDAGLTPSPDGKVLLYTSFPDNGIGQIKLDDRRPMQPSKLIDLATLGIAPSTGALTFVPQGFPGAGRLKITSYNANIIYDTTITPDGSGTFDIARPSASITLTGGVDTINYIKKGNPGFPQDSLLVAEFDSHKIAAYQLDARTGDPIPQTRRDFLMAVGNPSAAPNSVLSAVPDPLTGDLLICTWNRGLSQILAVRGFTR